MDPHANCLMMKFTSMEPKRIAADAEGESIMSIFPEEEFRAELLLLYTKRSPLRWFKCMSRMSTG